MARYTSTNSPSNLAVSVAQTTFDQIALNDQEQFGLVVAGDVGSIETDNTESSKENLQHNLAFYSKIKQSDVSKVAYRSNYSSGNVYNAWSQDRKRRNYYAFNPVNNIVYLCVCGAGNPDWRLDLEGQSISTSTPDNVCERLYPDNSRWVALYKVDAGQDLTHLGKYLPFRNLGDEDRLTDFYSSTNPRMESASICGSGKQQNTGTCCLYHKKGWYDEVTGIAYDAGDFYKCDCTKCYKCIDFAKRMDMRYVFTPHTDAGLGSGFSGDKCLGCDLESFPTSCGACSCRFYQDATDTPEKRIRDKYERTNPSSNIGVLGKILSECDLPGGNILSMFIDFGGLEKEQLKLKGKGPWPLKIESDTGYDAQWNVVGYTEDGGKTFYARGLEKINGGYGYLDVTITNLDSIFENGFSSNRLEVNRTPLNGSLVGNLDSVLEDVKIQIVKSFRSDYIRDNLGVPLDSFTRIGLVKNFKVSDANRQVGIGTNSNEVVDRSLITKVTGTPSTTSSSSSSSSKFSFNTFEEGKTTTSNIFSRSDAKLSNTTTNTDGTSTLSLLTLKPSDIREATSIKDDTTDITYTLDKTKTEVPKDRDDIIDVSSGDYLSTKDVNWTMPANRGAGQQAERNFTVTFILPMPGNV